MQVKHAKLNSTVAAPKKSRPKKSWKLAILRILHDFSCFLLIVNVLSFIAHNNMEALDIPQESLLAVVIRYGLYVGAIFQMICLGAVIFLVPRSSSKSTTAGAIWNFLRVGFCLKVFLSLNMDLIRKFLRTYHFRVILKSTVQVIHRHKKRQNVHFIAAENRIKKRDARSVTASSIHYSQSQ